MSRLVLEGLTVGVTADRRADDQIMMLRQRGARVMHGPALITAAATVDADTARVATQALIDAPPDVVVANTAIGMRTWLSLADGWGLDLVEVLANAYVAARGPKAAGALAAVGVMTDWLAPSSRLADVVEHVLQRGAGGRRVVLQVDGSGSADPEAERLGAAGAEVVTIPTYRWAMPPDRRPALRLIEAACTERLDAVTFTAAPAVHNLFALAAEHQAAAALRDSLNGRVLAMCVGPVCREAAHEHGVWARAATVARLGGLVKELAEELGGRRRRIVVGTCDVEVQGALVRAAGGDALLAGRERALFDLLARRPGAVVARSVLLGEVWGEAQADAHAMEVAVGRLRRKLASAGLGVEAVPRRGYRLTAI